MSYVDSQALSTKAANNYTVSDKNSWDTSTQLAVFFFTLAHLLVLPILFITGNSPNLAHQHWEGKKTAKCPNNFD